MGQLQAQVSVTLNAYAKLPQHIKVQFKHNGGAVYEKTALIETPGDVDVAVLLPDGADTNIANYTLSTYYMDGNLWKPTNTFRTRSALPVDLIGGIAFTGYKLGVAQ